MKRHPRSIVVQEAKVDFDQAFLSIEEKHGLTYGELFDLLSDRMNRLSRSLVQHERHPDDPDKSGDQA